MTSIITRRKDPCVFALDAEEQRFAIRILSNLVKRELDFSCETKSESNPRPYLKCIHCKSSSLVKRGKDSKGRQRYHCRDCGKSSTCHSGGILASTKLPLQTWLTFIESHIKLDSLRETASKCGVTLQTAFSMRRKMIQLCASQLKRTQGALASGQNTRSKAEINLCIKYNSTKTASYFIGEDACDNMRVATLRLGRTIVAHVHQHRLADRLSHQKHLRHSGFYLFIRRFKRVVSHTLGQYEIWYNWLIIAKLHMFAYKLSADALRALAESAYRNKIAISRLSLALDSVLNHWDAVNPFGRLGRL